MTRVVLLLAVLAAGAIAAARHRTAAARSVRRLSGRPARPAGLLPPGAPRAIAVVTAPPRLVALLRDAGVPERVLDAASLVWTGGAFAGVAVVGVALVVSGPLLAVLVIAGLVVAVRSGGSFLRGRAVRHVEADLPLALDELVRGLRSGASLAQALGQAATLPGPLGRDLREVVFVATHGGGLAAALEQWAQLRPLPGVRLTVAALALGLEAGGAQARAVDGVATTLRERQQLAAEVRALASQARLSAVVLSVAPLGFAALLAASDRHVADFFLHTPIGTLCLAAGLALDAAAAGWMGRVARVAR